MVDGSTFAQARETPIKSATNVSGILGTNCVDKINEDQCIGSFAALFLRSVLFVVIFFVMFGGFQYLVLDPLRGATPLEPTMQNFHDSICPRGVPGLECINPIMKKPPHI